MSRDATGGGFRGRRGTARNPGSNLAQLPVGLDFTGISLAEGTRAALASGIFLAIDVWQHSEPLLIAATGALMTCFCDVGGTVRQRFRLLFSFAMLGAASWAVFGLLRSAGPWTVIAAAIPAVFLFSMARVWGLRAQTVGNLLIVVLALAIDAPLTPRSAATFVLFFGLGGLWACVLTLLIWRIQPERPTMQAVARVHLALAELAGDLRRLVARDAQPHEWDAHALAHRRAVRGAIEDARALIASAAGARGLASGGTQRAAMTVEAADQLFGELIVLSEMLEGADDPVSRAMADRLLRRIRPVMRVLGQGGRRDRARLVQSLDVTAAGLDEGSLQALAHVIVDRLRVLVRVAEGQERMTLRAATAPPEAGWWSGRVWGPFRDELTTSSAILRHAARATLLTVPAIAVTLLWWTPYAHWLTITVALTMQPFFAATWQRALERIGGTMLGATIGGALAFLPSSPLVLGAALIVLSVTGFSVRQVSYGAYIACLTPLIVLVFDIAAPGHGPWTVAAMRTLYTLAGGSVAVAACLLLWPSWEPDRLRRELRGTLLAYAKLAAAVLAAPTAGRAAEAEEARRAAGLANSNLEASLSRALQEPGRRHRAELPKLIAADALLRRFGAMLLAVPHDASLSGVLDGPGRQAWRDTLQQACEAIAEGRLPDREPLPPTVPASSTLARARRALDVLGADLVQSSPPGAPNGSPERSRS